MRLQVRDGECASQNPSPYRIDLAVPKVGALTPGQRLVPLVAICQYVLASDNRCDQLPALGAVVLSAALRSGCRMRRGFHPRVAVPRSVDVVGI